MKRAKHILFHFLIWGVILFFLNTGNLSWQGFNTADGSMFLASLYGNFFNAFLVYLNALFLYPKMRASKVKYWFLALLLILGISFLEAGVDYFYAKQIGLLEANFESTFNEMKGEDLEFDLEENLPLLTYIAFVIDNIYVHVLFWFLSFAYILPIQTIRNRSSKEQLEREKLEAEVKFLKAQINPHTLFNGINSIYHLIDKDKEKAKEVLVGFSEILRYQIYECSDDEILLSRELLFLENYFNLEKIRKGTDIEINYDYTIDNTGNYKIAPLLLIPFVENAFKHVSNHNEKDRNFIRCRASIDENKLYFIVENSTDSQDGPEVKEQLKKGIGLANVRERLKLLYPEQHSLQIKNQNNVYNVSLNLALHE